MGPQQAAASKPRATSAIPVDLLSHPMSTAASRPTTQSPEGSGTAWNGELAQSWSGTHAHRADSGGHSTLGIPGEAAPYGPTLWTLRNSPSQMLLSDSEPPEFGLMLTAAGHTAGHNSLLGAQGSTAPGSLAPATDTLPVRAACAWAWMHIHTQTQACVCTMRHKAWDTGPH